MGAAFDGRYVYFVPAQNGSPGYTDARGLFFTWRAIDDNAPNWSNNTTTKNWVHELFLSGSTPSYLASFARPLVADSGATWAYQDCGVNATPVPAVCANHTT